MLTVKYIQKFRNKQNQIIGYSLQDSQGNTKDMTPQQLKQAIQNKQINVINLTLTSDNSLIDRSKKTDANTLNINTDDKILFINKCKNNFEIVNEEWALSTIPFSELNQGIVNKLNIEDVLANSNIKITNESLFDIDNECGLHIYWDITYKDSDEKSFSYGIYVYGRGDYKTIVSLKSFLGEAYYKGLKSFGLDRLSKLKD